MLDEQAAGAYTVPYAGWYSATVTTHAVLTA